MKTGNVCKELIFYICSIFLRVPNTVRRDSESCDVNGDGKSDLVVVTPKREQDFDFIVDTHVNNVYQ